jgi:hypothetical protein
LPRRARENGELIAEDDQLEGEVTARTEEIAGGRYKQPEIEKHGQSSLFSGCGPDPES